MAQGLERTEVTTRDANANRGRGAVQMPTPGSVSSPTSANFSQVGAGLDGLAKALGGATQYMAKMQDDANAQADMDARLAVARGKTRDELEKQGVSTDVLRSYDVFTQVAAIQRAGVEAEANLDPSEDPALAEERIKAQFSGLLGNVSELHPRHKEAILSTAERASQRLMVAHEVAYAQHVKERAVQSKADYVISSVEASADSNELRKVLVDAASDNDPNVTPSQRRAIIQNALLAADPSDILAALGTAESGGAREDDLNWAATIHAESSGRGDYGADGKLLTSPDGALGRAQVLPTTSADPGYGVRPMQITPDMTPEQINDERERVGRDLFTAWQRKFGSVTLAHMAYNWGPGNVDGWISRGSNPEEIPTETKKYLVTVEKYKQAHRTGAGHTVLGLTKSFVSQLGLDVEQARVTAENILREASNTERTFNLDAEKNRTDLLAATSRGEITPVELATQMESAGVYDESTLTQTYRAGNELYTQWQAGRKQLQDDMYSIVQGRTDGITAERQQAALDAMVKNQMESSGNADPNVAASAVITAVASRGSVPAYASRLFSQAFVNDGMGQDGKPTQGALNMYTAFASLRSAGHLAASDALLDNLPEATQAVILDTYSKDKNTGAEFSDALTQALMTKQQAARAKDTGAALKTLNLSDKAITDQITAANAEHRSWWITRAAKWVVGAGKDQRAIEQMFSPDSGQLQALVRHQIAVGYDPDQGVTPTQYARVAARAVLSSSVPMLNGQIVYTPPGTNIAALTGMDPAIVQEDPFAVSAALSSYMADKYPGIKTHDDWVDATRIGPIARDLYRVGSVARAVTGNDRQPPAFIQYDSANSSFIVYPRKADPVTGEPTPDTSAPKIRVPLADLGKHWAQRRLEQEDGDVWNSVLAGIHGAVGEVETAAEQAHSAAKAAIRPVVDKLMGSTQD